MAVRRGAWNILGVSGKVAMGGGQRQALCSVGGCANIWYRSLTVAKNTSVALGEHFTAFAHEQVASGRYGSTSEVIRAGLRLLEDEQGKVEALRTAIDDGSASGRPSPFDFDAWLVSKARAE